MRMDVDNLTAYEIALEYFKRYCTTRADVSDQESIKYFALWEVWQKTANTFRDWREQSDHTKRD